MASARKKYRCHVHNIVRDNASSMKKMRRLLKAYNDDLIVYGCFSHYLNLLGQSLASQVIIKHIVDVQKYFRNHHTPSAHVTEFSNSVKPQLPGDTGWNSQLTCIETFIWNWPAYLSIAQEHENGKLINYLNLCRQAKDMSLQWKPIAVAFVRLQSDKSGMAEGCHEWLFLLQNDTFKPYFQAVEVRLLKAIQLFHYVAFIHPFYRVATLCKDKREAAWLAQNSGFLPLLVAYDTQSSSFRASFFSECMLKTCQTLWWKGGVEK